jgi:serine/threonine protein kinase
MAPEIFEMQEYDAKADIWSVGCVFYEMLGEQALVTSQILCLCFCPCISKCCLVWLQYTTQSTLYSNSNTALLNSFLFTSGGTTVQGCKSQRLVPEYSYEAVTNTLGSCRWASVCSITKKGTKMIKNCILRQTMFLSSTT